jgi:hypothetical protein
MYIFYHDIWCPAWDLSKKKRALNKSFEDYMYTTLFGNLILQMV